MMMLLIVFQNSAGKVKMGEKLFSYSFESSWQAGEESGAYLFGFGDMKIETRPSRPLRCTVKIVKCWRYRQTGKRTQPVTKVRWRT